MDIFCKFPREQKRLKVLENTTYVVYLVLCEQKSWKMLYISQSLLKVLLQLNVD